MVRTMAFTGEGIYATQPAQPLCRIDPSRLLKKAHLRRRRARAALRRTD